MKRFIIPFRKINAVLKYRSFYQLFFAIIPDFYFFKFDGNSGRFGNTEMVKMAHILYILPKIKPTHKISPNNPIVNISPKSADISGVRH